MNNEQCNYTLRLMLAEREASLKECRDEIESLNNENAFLADLVDQYEEENELMIETLQSILDDTTYPLSASGKAFVTLEELGYLKYE